jgi:asparagine synthetase B (glutamine-hydrolysing)
MCGIFAVHGVNRPTTIRQRCIALSKKQRHRGPDWSGCHVGSDSVFVHERLAIVGVGESHHLELMLYQLIMFSKTLALSLL